MVILKGEKVILRYPKMSDAKWLFDNITDPEIAMGLGTQILKMKKLSEEQKWIKSQTKVRKKKESVSFIIVEKGTGNLIGSCGFNKFNLDEKYAVAGWWVAKKYFGKGYALDAVRQLLKYGFNKLKLNRIEAYVFAYNPRSFGFSKKLGFKQEGILRQRHSYRGKYYDEWVVGLLRKEAKI